MYTGASGLKRAFSRWCLQEKESVDGTRDSHWMFHCRTQTSAARLSDISWRFPSNHRRHRRSSCGSLLVSSAHRETAKSTAIFPAQVWQHSAVYFVCYSLCFHLRFRQFYSFRRSDLSWLSRLLFVRRESPVMTLGLSTWQLVRLLVR